MLETPQERVDLLKAGFSGKEIEELYIIFNDINIVRYPMHPETIEIDTITNLNANAKKEAVSMV